MKVELPDHLAEEAKVQKSIEQYHRACRKIFRSASGLKVLAMWKQKELMESALVPNDPTSSMYHLGRKEFVQEVLSHIKDEGVLDDILIETE